MRILKNLKSRSLLIFFGLILVTYQNCSRNFSVDDDTTNKADSCATCDVLPELSLSFSGEELNLKEGQSVGTADLLLAMQTDGNFVVYSRSKALWSTNTFGKCTSCQAVIQKDGNFVIYDTAKNSPIYNTGTFNHQNAKIQFTNRPPYVRILQNDGSWLWTSGNDFSGFTIKQGQFINVGAANSDLRFFLQSDGNLVLTKAKTPVWASNALSTEAVHAAYQSDGNLVVYTSKGDVVWSANTRGQILSISALPPYLTFNSSETATAGSFASAESAMAELWAGTAHFQVMNMMQIPTQGQLSKIVNSMNQGTQIVPVGNTWYLFNREYNFTTKPAACPADFARIVVRSSVDFGRTWSTPVVVATPNLGANECALVDGHAYYDSETNTWHYLAQSLTTDNKWNTNHYSLTAANPLAAFTPDPANPVITSGQLWSQICSAVNSVCPTNTDSEGTPEISMKKNGYFYVTFHGAFGNPVYGVRGVARTQDFHTWQTVGDGLPGVAIWSTQDCQAWSIPWINGTCIGGGHATTLMTPNYTYMLIESSDKSLICVDGQNWVAGLVRKNGNGFLPSGFWQHWPGNPLLQFKFPNARCSVQYQRLFYSNNSVYLTYWVMPADWSDGYFYITRLTPKNSKTN